MNSDRESIAQQMKELLIQRIGSGELRPGDRVVEAKLAEQVQASSIPVREAIRELVAMGVLEFAPRRGAWVREVSLAEIIESLNVYEIVNTGAADVIFHRLEVKRVAP